MTKQQERLQAGLLAIWLKGLPHVRAQLEVLQRFNDALSAGSPGDELCREAEREAHRLAGSVGSFGFHDASAKARELELMLGSGRDLEGGRVATLVADLRTMLDREELPELPPKRPREN